MSTQTKIKDISCSIDFFYLINSICRTVQQKMIGPIYYVLSDRICLKEQNIIYFLSKFHEACPQSAFQKLCTFVRWAQDEGDAERIAPQCGQYLPAMII